MMMIKISFQEKCVQVPCKWSLYTGLCVCAMFGISHLFLLLRINPFILDSSSKVPQKMVKRKTREKKDGPQDSKIGHNVDEIIVHEIGARKFK